VEPWKYVAVLFGISLPASTIVSDETLADPLPSREAPPANVAFGQPLPAAPVAARTRGAAPVAEAERIVAALVDVDVGGAGERQRVVRGILSVAGLPQGRGQHALAVDLDRPAESVVHVQVRGLQVAVEVPARPLSLVEEGGPRALQCVVRRAGAVAGFVHGRHDDELVRAGDAPTEPVVRIEETVP
jgi:hypothetical protein